MNLLVSNIKGEIFDVPGVEPVGMKAGCFFRLKRSDFIKLPHGSEIFILPGRAPVGYDTKTGKFILQKWGLGVAAFVSPGHTTTYSSAYIEKDKAKVLPLFSYAAVGFHKGKLYAASLKVDNHKKHDFRPQDINKVRKHAIRIKKLFPKNRLIKHLEACALKYACPNAKNFFLSRFEAPLPSSPICNSSCMGCISFQPNKACPVTQPRINFTPMPEEIAEVALFHIDNTRDALVSFGQGCEGEPLMAGDVLEKAIRLIRSKAQKGIINLNTNASKPEVLLKLFDSGLNSIRVSVNSVRELYYTRYYKPRGYNFKNVLQSIRLARKRNIYTSVNYLTMPGFTDLKDEVSAFRGFLKEYNINMIQWRNLNYDPVRYFAYLKLNINPESLIGIKEHIQSLKKDFPTIRMGYFNPSIGKM